MAARKAAAEDPRVKLLTQMAVGLQAFAADDYELAAVALASAVPKMSATLGVAAMRRTNSSSASRTSAGRELRP